MKNEPLQIAFDNQISVLIERGVHELAGLSQHSFLELIEPLSEQLPLVTNKKGHLPFLIALKGIDAGKLMGSIELEGRHGEVVKPFSARNFEKDAIADTARKAYLLVDISLGRDSLGVSSEVARKVIHQEGRSPLTLSEGVLLVLQYPELLESQNAFSMAASHHGNQIPIIKVSYGKPQLTSISIDSPQVWLGSASAGMRIDESVGKSVRI